MVPTRLRRSNPQGQNDTDLKGAAFEQIVQRIGLVAAPLTLITALLFYIGWVRTDQVYEHFGVDLSLVGLSNQDYILRSVDGIYIPLGVVLVLALTGLRLHGLMRRSVVQARRQRAVSITGWAT